MADKKWVNDKSLLINFSIFYDQTTWDKVILPEQDQKPSFLSCFKSGSSTLGTLHQRGRARGSSQGETLTLLELPWVSKACCQGNPDMMVSATLTQAAA